MGLDTALTDDEQKGREADVDLSAMTKSQLLEYAAAHGVAGVSSSQTKAVIIEKIKEAV